MAARVKHVLDVGGRKVPVTNLEKVLFPSGFKKGQVIDYYIRVADYLLPHASQRPITLKRFPDGLRGPHFYEKDAPSYTPAWVSTFAVPRRSGESNIHYVLINDLASLVWSANTANLEIHPFLARVPDIGRPTFVVFDLDPGEGVDILGCTEVAYLLKDALERMKLQCWAKVSGSKGIQVYVPLNTPVTYAETQPFARALAQSLERAHPDRVISDMSKSVRHGKVFIDWSQNSDFKTTVCVYSLRAKSDTPFISMPVTWEELRRAKKASALYFEVEPALRRLSKAGDLFAPVLKLKQKLPSASAFPATPATPPAPRRPARKAAFIEPMRAKLVSALPEGPEWQYEIKFDGYRAIGVRTSDGVALYSRNGGLLNSRFPSIAAALQGLSPGDTVDGEVIALDSRGRPSFNALQNSGSSRRPVLYYVFDLLAHDGKDILDLPLRGRRKLLESSGVREIGGPIRISEALEGTAKAVVAAARDQGLEGIVAKRLNSTYQAGAKSGAWVKFKVNQGQEFVIGGYIPGGHGFDSLLVGYYDAGKLIFMAKVRNGFVPRTREQVFERLRPLETPVCPFANLPEPKNTRRGHALTAEFMQQCRWVKPDLVAQVEFTEVTGGEHLRHSRFVALRDDKDPLEVVLERPAAEKPSRAARG